MFQFPGERSGEVRLCSTVRDFFDFISHQDLMDLPLADGSFTWLLNILLYGLGLIVSLSPHIRKLNFQWFYRRGFLVSIRTSFRSFLIVVMFLGGADLSNLRTCGLRRKVLWGW
jgi:hypothetical protein